nr:MAG TPA: hypothetical protein [Caudoviricetes sp.]
MERLTERTADGILVKENYEKETLKTLYQCYGEKPNSYYSNCEEGYCAMEKLADYEDLDEQGRLIKLPCNVGDVLYFAHHDRVISSEVLSAKYHAEAENHGVFIRERLTIDVEGVSAEIDFGDIGKTVFLTKSEAEAKLKELRGGENG